MAIGVVSHVHTAVFVFYATEANNITHAMVKHSKPFAAVWHLRTRSVHTYRDERLFAISPW